MQRYIFFLIYTILNITTLSIPLGQQPRNILVNNPRTRPLLEALDYAQRINTIGSITAADVSSTITAPALIDDFCRYYSNHRNKTVVFYFDATALGSNYAVNDQDFRWWVIHDCSCK